MTQLIKKLSEPKPLLLIGVLYTLLVTIAFLFPKSQIPQVNILELDKLVHVLIHGILSFIWLCYWFSTDKYHFSNKIVFVILSVCFLYGLAIEASQHLFTLSRQFDAFDILANSIGSLIGLLAFWIFIRVKNQ
ncbi:VanZ family protein [Ulvibacter antarcticus]|uniref:VanZ like protein n=1 Tax=Ulvibacter antarcticus TaxID=442714 RepID=A0A3L9Z0Z2_9FLAO|nr:VanZ like protein [Ulvibacter antarcticus]